MVNRRGLSEIIGASLLVLLALTASFGVFYYVKDSVDISSSPEVSCFDLNLESTFEFGSSCLDEDLGEIQTTVFHSQNDFGIKNIEFIFSGGGETISRWGCGENHETCSLANHGTSKKYYFSEANAGAVEEVLLFEGRNNCLIDRVSLSVC